MKSNETNGAQTSKFSYQVTVGEEDIDGLNHANNSCYVKWCEQAAWAHSDTLGINLNDYQALDRAMAIRHADYDYILSTYKGDELCITTWLEPVSNLKMKRLFQVTEQRNGKLVLSATWDLVCIEISSGKPKRLPKEFIVAYTP